MIDDIFSKKHIILDSDAKTKKDVFLEISNLAKQLNIVDKATDLVKGFEKREEESTTALEDGFSIPHCKSSKINSNAVFLLRLKNEIKWDDDGSKVKVVFALVVCEKNANNLHLKLLSGIAKSLLDDKFKKQIQSETNKDEIVKLLNSLNVNDEKQEATASNNNEKDFIIAVTACPTGIAHTFMAQENLEKAAKKMNYDIKVETHGADGAQNALTEEDIKRAKFVILAVNVNLSTERFVGKKLYQCTAGAAVKNAQLVIQDAIKKGTIVEKIEEDDDDDIFKIKNSKRNLGIMRHLMFGLSYMIPIVVIGGIFLALSAGISKAVYNPQYDPSKHPGTFFYFMSLMSNVGFSMMIPVFAGMVAFSIAGKAAFAPALVSTTLATVSDYYFQFNYKHPISYASTGILGGVAFGLAIGYTVKWMTSWKIKKTLKPIMPIIFIPITVTFVYGMFGMFLFGPAIGWIMNQFQTFVNTYWKGDLKSTSSIFIGLGFGALLGAMIGFDLGGPINKTAVLTATGMIGSGIYTPMGAVACAIPVAPLGMGLATVFMKKLFDKGDKNLGNTALVLSFLGITEGSIPFAIKNPKQAVPANIIGSAVAGALAGVLGIACLAGGYGGPLIALLGAFGKGNGDTALLGWGSGAVWTLVGVLVMIVGGIVTALIFSALLMVQQRKENTLNNIQGEVLEEQQINVAKN